MKQHFDIRYEFDVPAVHNAIEKQLTQGKPDYICVADGNILTMVHNDEEYRQVVNGGMFSICDSSWVPKFTKWIYGHEYSHYCGSDIFIDIVRARKHRMMFLGTKQKVLDALRDSLATENPDVAEMRFMELPFCTADEFDYKGIAETVNNDGADIVWVALGAPKQEIFMSRLKPYLNKGVMIAIGAAFNFYSGLPDAPQRCPEWMRRMHLEFVHRIFTEPKKQIRRCWHIVTTLPDILYKEYKIKKNNNN